MQRLVLVISSLKPGGAERVLSELANYWRSKGHDVCIVTLASPKDKPFYFLDSRIRLIQLGKSQMESSFFLRFLNIFKRIFSLRKTLKLLDSDIIISFVDMMNLTTLIAAWGLKVPVIVSERTHPAYYKLPDLYQKLRYFLYPKAAYVVMQTESSATYFKGFSNLEVIPNAVQRPPKTKIWSDENIRQIISVGRLCPYKGFDTLINAFSVLVKEYVNLRLTIYGEGLERSKLECLIQSLDLCDKISLPGLTKNIQEALLEADIFVFPSHYEGFPNALCEAMAAGLPVIASNCSGNIDIIRDGVDGRLFPVGDVKILTKIMRELLENSAECKQLAQVSKEICLRFNSESIFSMWDDIIKKAKDSAFFFLLYCLIYIC